MVCSSRVRSACTGSTNNSIGVSRSDGQAGQRASFLGESSIDYAGRRFFRNSDKAIRHADLINVPNEEEAVCLRQETGTDRPILVQPYGLTDERRQALLQATAPPRIRLSAKENLFHRHVGSAEGCARLGRDHSNGFGRVVPEAKFRFLGTMVDSQAILADLQLETLEGVEFVSDYQPGAPAGVAGGLHRWRLSKLRGGIWDCGA